MSSEVNAGHTAVGGRTLRLAAVQMDANPAPTMDRLARAERLVVGAVEAGAQLVVLPEFFNTGYAYSNENHARVETIHDPTARWMREITSRLDIHLAGSLMLLEQGDVYNALLLLAPDGRMWRYDKNYPGGWERGYFRAPRDGPLVTVAETDLGDIGMLVCWDSSHVNLWEMYMGRVDLMIISSCPVDIGQATYHLPNGDSFTADDMGSRVASAKGAAQLTFGEMINQQTAWLGVPAVQASQCGHIRTDVPMGRRALLGYLLTAPRLLKHFGQANEMQMSCHLVHECKILNSSGEVLARLTREDGEGYVVAEVGLAPSKTIPLEPQPVSPVGGTAYFLADVYLPKISEAVYRTGRRQWKDVQTGVTGQFSPAPGPVDQELGQDGGQGVAAQVQSDVGG